LDGVYAKFREAIRQFFARQTGSRTLAEDLTQIVYLRLLNSRTLATVQDPEMYIYATAWNVLRTEMKSAAFERRFNVSVTDSKLEAEVTANRLLWVDDSSSEIDAQYFMNGLRGLPRPLQAVFILHYIDGLTYEQISEETGINVHTVHKYISRALVRLHALYGVDPSSDSRVSPNAKERT
jgi:RNA polymerase sigma-70 factor (ECF subfamily)